MSLIKLVKVFDWSTRSLLSFHYFSGLVSVGIPLVPLSAASCAYIGVLMFFSFFLFHWKFEKPDFGSFEGLLRVGSLNGRCVRSLFLAVECSYDVKNIKKKILETPFFSGPTHSVGIPLVPISVLRLYRGPNVLLVLLIPLKIWNTWFLSFWPWFTRLDLAIVLLTRQYLTALFEDYLNKIV